MESSCIVKHFQHYAAISTEEQDLLGSLEKSPKEYSKNSYLWHQGDLSEEFYSVKRVGILFQRYGERRSTDT